MTSQWIRLSFVLQLLKNCAEHPLYQRWSPNKITKSEWWFSTPPIFARPARTDQPHSQYSCFRSLLHPKRTTGFTHIWPCLSCQRSWLPFTPDCKFCVKLFWDIIVIQTPLLTMAVFISCLLKHTYCIDLTNFIPSILTYMQFYLHSVKWGGGDGGSWLLAYCLFTRLLISSFPGYFLLARPLEMSVRHEVGLVDMTKVGKVNVVTCQK